MHNGCYIAFSEMNVPSEAKIACQRWLPIKNFTLYVLPFSFSHSICPLAVGYRELKLFITEEGTPDELTLVLDETMSSCLEQVVLIVTVLSARKNNIFLMPESFLVIVFDYRMKVGPGERPAEIKLTQPGFLTTEREGSAVILRLCGCRPYGVM